MHNVFNQTIRFTCIMTIGIAVMAVVGCGGNKDLPESAAPVEEKAVTPPPQAQKAEEPSTVVMDSLPREFIDYNGISFVLIPSGEFEMGGGSSNVDALPVHTVRITRPFYMGKYEVTQKQWYSVMGNNPSWYKGEDRPVESISWDDIQIFLRRLNQLEGKNRYRMPTEAEWEYACHAGTAYTPEADLNTVAWHEGNSGGQTHPVGLKKPNAWGLYDMLGNVFEWCRDRYGPYPTDMAIDPKGATSGLNRVYRGGSVMVTPKLVDPFDRKGQATDYRIENLGFRLARNAE